MSKPRKPRGPNRVSKKAKLRALLEAGVPIEQAIGMVGYARGGKRELPRLTSILALVDSTNLQQKAEKTLRDLILAGDPATVVQAVPAYLERRGVSARQASTGGACTVVFIEQGERVEREHIPSTIDPQYACTAEQAIALIDAASTAEPSAESSDVMEDRELCERALARVLADRSAKDPTVIKACREILSTLVTSPNDATCAQRTLALSVYNARGPIPSDATIIYLRGIALDDVMRALDAREKAAA